MEEEQIQHQDYVSHSNPVCPATPETSNASGFPMMPVYSMGVGSGVISVPVANPMEKLILGQGILEHNGPPQLVRSIPVVPDPTASAVSNITSSSNSAIDPLTLSLGLSLSSDQRQTSSRHSSIHAMACFSIGDNIISVA